MNKKILIGVTMLLFLVAGLMIVSANLPSENNAVDAPEGSSPECGSGACNFDCGGECGIPSCGCGG